MLSGQQLNSKFADLELLKIIMLNSLIFGSRININYTINFFNRHSCKCQHWHLDSALICIKYQIIFRCSVSCLKIERNSASPLIDLISNYKWLVVLLEIACLAQKHVRYSRCRQQDWVDMFWGYILIIVLNFEKRHCHFVIDDKSRVSTPATDKRLS